MYYACVCAIAKDETPHLREWALHHFAVGFEHIVLYDNGSAVPAARTLADLAKGCTCPPDFPVCVCGKVSKGSIITRKPILPSEEEMETNSRSKSAKLRIFERR